MRSEFQDVFKDAYDHWIDDACSHRYHASKSLALQVWQHQQSKVDELQKQRDSFIKAYEIEMEKSIELQKNNAWLSGVACRENKRANKLQEENVNTTVLLGKTIQEKNELQKRVDAALERANQACIGNEMFHKQFDDVIRILRGEQALKGGGE